ncbi:hypothetical protein, partial [Flavobacterium sp. BFFFF1]|uniref:hypothetical protein n=1 Tax=Flavobacterium sp. BFFFF1 TaxID=2015557 RepID=UPI0025B92B2A
LTEHWVPSALGITAASFFGMGAEQSEAASKKDTAKSPTALQQKSRHAFADFRNAGTPKTILYSNRDFFWR